MKRKYLRNIATFILVITTLLSFVACSREGNNSATEEERVEMALQGTWIIETTRPITYVFHSGEYTTYFVANNMEFVDIGDYTIEAGIIKMTHYNSNGDIVSGQITYEYDGEELKLIGTSGRCFIRKSDETAISWGSDAIVSKKK